MMKAIPGLLFLLASICVFLVGCGSDNGFVATTGNVGPGSGKSASDPDPGAGFAPLRQVNARVVLPNGVNIDFTNASVMSQLTQFGVDADGSTIVSLEEGGRVLAILFDANDEPILMGFVTDTQNEISLETSVQASLYVGMGTVLLPAEVRQLFWDNVTIFEGYDQLLVDAEALFQNDPLFFQSAAYRDLITAYIETLLGTNPLDVQPRLITDPTVRSGIQVMEAGGDAVVLVNNTRRRAHAFAYKLDFTDTSGARHELIQETAFLNGNPGAKLDVSVGPAAGVSSLIGTAQGLAGGKGAEYAAKESDPIDLSLGPQEKQAHYSIRVVGPATVFDPNLPTAEKDKLFDLRLETFGFDYMFPLLFLVVGQDDLIPEAIPTFVADNALLESIENLVNAVPGSLDNIKKGDFQQALRDVVDGFVDGGAAALFEPILTGLVDQLSGFREGIGKPFSQDQAQRILGSTKSALKVLKAVDILLQMGDWARIGAAIDSAQVVEDFRVTVTQNIVTLIPPDTAVAQGSTKSIKAVIQDGAATLGGGESFEYRWSTSGTYGSLRDTVGNKGTSFASSRDTVEYVAGEGALPDDAMDTVTVEVVIKGPGSIVPVGEPDEPAKLRIRPRGFEIYPDDLEVQGGNSVPLSVRLTDGEDPFSSSIFDYKVTWSTPGRFGLFNGTTTSVTDTTKNTVIYECLEKEQDGTETVSVSIYSKLKGEPGPFLLDDKVSAAIKINNDKDTKIFYVKNSQISGSSKPGIFHNWYVRTVFDFAPIPNAETYRMTVIEHNPDAKPTYIGKSGNWTAGNPDDLVDGVYRVITSSASGSTTSGETAAKNIATALARQSSYQCLAKMVVTLKSN
jgi:hypothetical protein